MDVGLDNTQIDITIERRDISIPYALDKFVSIVSVVSMFRLCYESQIQTMKTTKKQFQPIKLLDKCKNSIELSSRPNEN